MKNSNRLSSVATRINISTKRASNHLISNRYINNYTENTKLTKEEIECLEKEFINYYIKKKELDYELLDYLELDNDDKNKSFENILGNYLINAINIIIIDPYIRVEHQIRNFIEFSHIVMKNSKKLKKLTLITGFKDNEQRVINDKLFKEFKRIAKSKFNYEFNYDFKEGVHDRSIEIDNGIKIIIGRGLDFYKNVNRNTHNKYETLSIKKTFIIVLKRIKA